MTEPARNPGPTSTDRPVPVDALHYRPRDYFAPYDLETRLLTRVKGRARRAAIREALAAGEIDQLPDVFKAEEFNGDDRDDFGLFHFGARGGEYLPALRANEVEIARINLNSTNCDVVTVYARPVGRRIAYRVVDEYEGDMLEEVTTRTSMRPLTMGQLIDFLLGAWDLFECLEANDGHGLAWMLGFFWAESEFYPRLDDTLRAMVEERYAGLGDEDEMDDEVDEEVEDDS